MIAIGSGWAAWSYFTVPVVAIVGAVGATLAVVVLAKQGASTERLLLAGFAILLTGFGVPYVLPIVLWVIGVAGVITVIQRMVEVSRQLRPAK